MAISEFELQRRIDLLKDLLRLYLSFFAESPKDLEIMKAQLADYLTEGTNGSTESI